MQAEAPSQIFSADRTYSKKEKWKRCGVDSIHVDDYQHDINDTMMINIVSFSCWSNIYDGALSTY